MKLFFIIISTAFLFHFSVQQEMSSINRLRTQLKKDYQRNARPVKNHKTPTNISVGFWLYRIVDVDIDTSAMKSFNYILLEWIDQHLIWNPSDYDGLDEVVMEWNEIWTPDIRSFDFERRWKDGLGYEPLVVNASGFVTWYTSAVFQTYCKIDLKDFPFDQQTCTIKFASWTYDSLGIKLYPSKSWESLVYGPRKPNAEWKVLNVSEETVRNNETEKYRYDVFSVKVLLQRRNAVYFYSTVVPYMAALSFAFLSFMEPLGSLRRLTLVMVSFTILSILLIRLTLTLGFHSISVPFGIKCTGISILMVTISTLLPLLVSCYLTANNVLLPRVIIDFVGNPIIQTLLCVGHPEKAPQDQVNKECFLLTMFMDRICFISFIFLAAIYHS